MKLLTLFNDMRNINEVIAQTVEVLQRGGVIVYPTDTVYGLGGNALDVSVIDRVYDIKRRPRTNPLSIVVPDMLWVRELAHISAQHEKVLNALWPGPVTVVLEKRSIVPDTLVAHTNAIAIRIPDNTFVNTLVRKFGYPLIATSANIAGKPESCILGPVIDMFDKGKRMPDLYIDAGTLPARPPSTILDLTGQKPRITRVGMTKPQELMKLLET